MATVCSDDRKNVGVSQCRALPQLFKRFITVPKAFTVALADIGTKATWQDLLKNPKSTRGYLFPQMKQIENVSQDPTYAETQLATSLQFQGRHRFRFSFEDGIYNHRQMATHRLAVDRLILVDNNDRVYLTSSDGGANFTGFTVDLFNPEKMMFNNQTDPTRSPIYVSLENYKELDDRGYMFAMPFVNDLFALTDVSLRVEGTPTSSEIIVKVYYTETEDANTPDDEVPILGLAQADFTLVDGSGADQSSAISGITDNGDGTYTIAGTGFVTGEIDLVAPASISVTTYAIESTGAATVTI